MDGFCLLFASVGTGLGSVTQLLEADDRFAVRDIEHRIKNDQHTTAAMRRIGRGMGRDLTMEDVTSLPRSEVRELWRDHAQQCLHDLSRASEPVKVLSGHLVYYSGRRNEFYCPIDIDVLRGTDPDGPNLRPTSLVLLVDDIYDVFARLRGANELFCAERFHEFARMVSRDPDGLGPDECRQLVLAWKYSALTRLLAWRSMEILVAEHLAQQLETERFLVLAVKQLGDVLKRWITEPQASSVYISHPISEPRRVRAIQGSWPGVVDEINSLPLELLEFGLVPVSPTGIDEFRLETSEGFLAYTGRLSPRWPLQGDAGNQLVYAAPEAQGAPDHLDILLPERYDFTERDFATEEGTSDGPDYEGQVHARSLKAMITEQVSSRDHLFVLRCSSILVYRPFYGGRARFSGGVEAELNHWAELAEMGVEKRVAFVHFEEDVKQMLQARSQDRDFPLRGDIVQVIGEAAKEQLRVRERADLQSLIQTGRLRPGTILNGDAKRADEVERRYPEIEREAVADLLQDYLTCAHLDRRDLIGVWLVPDFTGFRSRLGEITDFLRGRGDSPSDVTDRASEFLPHELWT